MHYKMRKIYILKLNTNYDNKNMTFHFEPITKKI